MTHGKQLAAQQLVKLHEAASDLGPDDWRDYWDTILEGVIEVPFTSRKPLKEPSISISLKPKWWNVWGLFPKQEDG